MGLQSTLFESVNVDLVNFRDARIVDHSRHCDVHRRSPSGVGSRRFRVRSVFEPDQDISAGVHV